MRLRATLGLLGALALIGLLAVLLRPPAADPDAPASVDPATWLRVVSLARLPVEAQETVRRIDRGGPFPYPKDGSAFSNRERLLPIQPDGFYREYTWPSPSTSRNWSSGCRPWSAASRPSGPGPCGSPASSLIRSAAPQPGTGLD